MKFKWNPFTNNLDLVGTSGGGGGTTITVVANYSALPSVASASGQFYWVSNSQGTSWLPGSLGGTYYSAGQYYSNGVTWEYLSVPYQATLAEVNTGTNNDKFVTPSTFTNADKWGTKQNVISLTTTGSSGPATLIGDVLNIPQYSGGVAPSLIEYEIDFGATPVFVNSGEFIQVVKKKVGTAPSAGVIAHMVTYTYGWE